MTELDRVAAVLESCHTELHALYLAALAFALASWMLVLLVVVRGRGGCGDESEATSRGGRAGGVHGLLAGRLPRLQHLLPHGEQQHPDRALALLPGPRLALSPFWALARGSHGALAPVEEALSLGFSPSSCLVSETAYADDMKLTLQVQLLPTVDDAAQLRATVERFHAAANWLAGEAFAARSANKVELQRAHYRELRNRFGLSAQMAVRCIAQVCEAYKRDRTIRPTFRRHAAMPFDQRMMSFKGLDRVSLLTLEGRVIVPIVMGRYQAERYTHAKGQCDLVRRKDGKWFLLVTVEVPDGTPTPATDFIGVDFGIVAVVTDSDGQTFSGKAVENIRRKHNLQRQRLQRRGTTGAKKKLKRVAAKESRFRRHENHVISKRIVATAKRTGRGIALEELQGIRERIRARGGDARNRLSGWSFHQLRSFIDYKARLAGVPVAVVDPRNTSRTCSECGHCEKANRKSQESFVCQHCGFSANADWNAARNIRALANCNVATGLDRLSA